MITLLKLLIAAIIAIATTLAGLIDAPSWPDGVEALKPAIAVQSDSSQEHNRDAPGLVIMFRSAEAAIQRDQKDSQSSGL